MKKRILFFVFLFVSIAAFSESINAFGFQGSVIVGSGFPHEIKSAEELFEKGEVVTDDFGLSLDFFRRRYWTEHFATSFRHGLEGMYFPVTYKLFADSVQIWEIAGNCFDSIPVLGPMGGIFMGCIVAVVDICIPVVWFVTSDLEFNFEYLPYRNKYLDTVLSIGASMFHLMPNAQLKGGITVKAGHLFLTSNVGYRMYFTNFLDMNNFDFATDGHKFVADIGLRIGW